LFESGGKDKMVTVVVDEKKCDGDGICVTTCPVAVFEMQRKGDSEKSVPKNESQCIVCRACEAQCPKSAITVTE